MHHYFHFILRGVIIVHRQRFDSVALLTVEVVVRLPHVLAEQSPAQEADREEEEATQQM